MTIIRPDEGLGSPVPPSPRSRKPRPFRGGRLVPGFDFLRTRVAGRILGLLAVGAAVPVTLLAVTSYAALTHRLGDQSQARLLHVSRAAGASVVQRIDALADDLRRMDEVVSVGSAQAVGEGAGSSPQDWIAPPRGVQGLALLRQGSFQRLSGSVAEPWLAPFELDRLRRGLPVVRSVAEGPDRPARLFMGVPLESDAAGPRALWARLDVGSVWKAAALPVSGPSVADFCVLDGQGRALHCAGGRESRLLGAVPAVFAWPEAGVTELTDEGLRVSRTDVPLRASYGQDPWTVVVAEDQAEVYVHAFAFAYAYPSALVVGLAAVLLLAKTQVRRTMEPLVKLTEGTRRIARKDLSARVPVQSRDEFGTLARSFNTMADHLGLQFRQLETGWSIDRAVLSSVDSDSVAGALLSGFASVIPCGRIAVALVVPGRSDRARLYAARASLRLVDGAEIPTTRRDWMTSARELEVVGRGEPLPPLLVNAGFGSEDLPAVVLPLVSHGEVRGAMLVGSADGREFSDEELSRARQIVDQAAVAFTEVQLRSELEDVSWGALRALARAIDAKSRWTAGHSERVTELSLELAREMDLSEQELDVLHRGGLLHDLGKIGVPAEVLDGPGPLSPAARRIMEEHPVVGVRILEPLRAFEPILPIVLSHHERWDGRGYPEGLKGEEIHPLARVLAVADTFDAMVSARPYRTAMDPEVVLDYIVSQSGTALEPDPVRALVNVMARGWTPREVTMDVGAD